MTMNNENLLKRLSELKGLLNYQLETVRGLEKDREVEAAIIAISYIIDNEEISQLVKKYFKIRSVIPDDLHAGVPVLKTLITIVTLQLDQLKIIGLVNGVMSYTQKEKELIENMVSGFRKVHSKEKRRELISWYSFASSVKDDEKTKQIMQDIGAI